MRTTIDIPDEILKKAKIKAVEDGISLKDFFLNALEKQLGEKRKPLAEAPWKKLKGKGSAESLNPEDSGFEGYSGPDWNHGLQVNEPDS